MENVCPNCGSPYVYDESLKRFKCRYCGYIKPREVLPEEEALLFSAAQRLRLADFDGAQEAYEDIAARFPECAEARWGLALCEYGIKYEDDYDGKKIPTCYATRYESLLESPNYKKAVSLADDETKAYYRSQASLIERVREEWVEKAKKEPPYDIFLSFKDTDEGKRTEDSYDAYEIYNNLTRAGYRVFFSRVTLAGKSGENYEPYIFAALNSAPCMLLFASKPEYVTSTWVKNEWMRYLARIRQKKKSPDSLCVVFKDFNPSSLPAVLRGKQNLKYGELTFLEDLKAYCDKIVSAAKAIAPKIERKEVALAKKQTQKALRGMEAVEATSTLTKKVASEIKADLARRELGSYQVKKLTASQESLLFQAEIYLSKSDFDKAQELYHQVLVEDPKNPSALLGDLLVSSRTTTLKEWVKKKLPKQTDLTSILPLINYSSKEVSTTILEGYASLIVSKAKAKEYKAADSVYSAICDYDLECVNVLHQKLFDVVCKDVSDSSALSLAEKALLRLSSDKEAYRLGLERLASSCLKAKNYAKAQDCFKTYSDYFDFSAQGYLVSLQAKTYTSSQEDLFREIADKKEFGLLSKDLPLGEKEIDDLFAIVAKFALEHFKTTPNLALTYVNFLLPFRFSGRQEFIDSGIQTCLETESLDDSAIFDALLSTFGNERIDQYVQNQLDYVAEKVASHNNALVCDTLSKRLQSLLDYAPNSKRLHHLRVCLLCHSPEKEQPNHFCSLKDFGPLESILSLRGKKKVDEVLSPYFDAFYKSITNDETSLSDHQDTFDALCSYYPKEENQELYTRFTYQATQARERGEFDVAVKYYSIIVQEYPNDHRFHWRLLQVKLGCKTNEELIHQMVPIGELPDYANAKIAAGTDRETIAHYIDIEMRQAQWIRAEEERIAAEEAKRAEEKEKEKLRKAKKRRKRIFFLTAIGVAAAVVTLSILAANVFIPAGRVNNALQLLKEGDYTGAIEALDRYPDRADWYGIETFGEGRNIYYMAEAGQAFRHKNYESAIDYVIQAGGVVRVNYDGDGKSTQKTNEIIKSKRAYIENESTQPGYTLSGWEQTNFKITVEDTSYSADLWLKAKFEIDYYSISYDLGGGELDKENPTSYTVEDAFELKSPTKTGYAFLGWYDAKGKKMESIQKGTTGNISLFAKWEANKYTIALDPNGGSVDPSLIEAVFDQPYRLPAPSGGGKKGYSSTFLGWYDGNTKIQDSGIWRFASNKELTAKWQAISYSITYDLDGGTNNPNNPSTYTVESSFALFSPTKNGHTFLGWFDASGEKVTSISQGTTENLTLFAKWEANKYTIALDPNGGSVDPSSIEVTYGQQYQLPTPTKNGCEFLGWYDNYNWRVRDNGTWLNMDTELSARWQAIPYAISYDLAGGELDKENPTSYTVEDAFELKSPTKTGYAFLGWYDAKGKKMESIQKGSIGDLSLTARWLGDQHQLSVTSSDNQKGTIVIQSGAGRTGEEIVVQAVPARDCKFRGWHSDGLRISSEHLYSFEMPNSDYSLEAVFWTKTEEEEWNAAHATTPAFKYGAITYGIYPQSHVNDSSLIASLNRVASKYSPEANGWYLFNGEYYAKQTAKPYSTDYQYGDGTLIAKDSCDWFLCKPIEWKVLSSEAGEALVVSSLLLDAHCYNDSGGNNYKESKIRAWLNSEFLDTAFSLGSSSILTTMVDNSAATTGSSTNPHACEDTQDKAFLLSYQDYRNASYGFSSNGFWLYGAYPNTDPTRSCRTTDWAKAKGASGNTYGTYWTRSPRSDTSGLYVNSVWEVFSNGYFKDNTSYFVSNTHLCARPALRIKIT